MTSALRVCPSCGAEIPTDAPEGGCPGCLLESALKQQQATKSERLLAIVGELGDYELLEEVGRGGQGVVFRARQKSLNRTVALKVISLGQWASQAHVKRFRREAEAAARLEHPGIVPIHEVGERDGSCYFSMQFIEGGQLDEVVKRTSMSIRQAAEMVAKVARTVHSRPNCRRKRNLGLQVRQHKTARLISRSSKRTICTALMRNWQN